MREKLAHLQQQVGTVVAVEVDSLCILPHIPRHRRELCQHGAFRGAIVASVVSTECPGGYVGYIWKARKKGYSEMYGSVGGPGTFFFRKIGRYS